MTELCPYCGTMLIKCVNGWFCPNHGLMIELKEVKEEDDRREVQS